MRDTGAPSAQENGEVLQITVTLSVRVIDPAALTAAATRALQNASFSDSESRATALAEVGRSTSAALEEVVDAAQLLDGVAGVEVISEVLTVGAASQGGGLAPHHGSAARTELLSARTAAILHTVLLGLARTGEDLLRDLADSPVASESHGQLFGMLPQFTWHQDAQWRTRFLQAFEALGGDLAAGIPPEPRTPAEEMALELAIVHADGLLRSDPRRVEQAVGRLPASPRDYDWNACRDHLFQDGDLLLLLQPGTDGLEDPENGMNRELGIGDYRPQAWFQTFDNAEPRGHPVSD